MHSLGETCWGKFLPTRGNEKRARPALLEGLLHLRKVKLVKAAWNESLITESCEFPVGAHDDLVDCLSPVARHLLQFGRGPREAEAVKPRNSRLDRRARRRAVHRRVAR
jgi:hypothetical protein